MQQLNRPLHILAQTACSAAEQSCKETECAELYTQGVCRKETLWEWLTVITEVREQKSGGEENTDKIGR